MCAYDVYVVFVCICIYVYMCIFVYVYAHVSAVYYAPVDVEHRFSFVCGFELLDRCGDINANELITTGTSRVVVAQCAAAYGVRLQSTAPVIHA